MNGDQQASATAGPADIGLWHARICTSGVLNPNYIQLSQFMSCTYKERGRREDVDGNVERSLAAAVVSHGHDAVSLVAAERIEDVSQTLTTIHPQPQHADRQPHQR